jgi:hypothetical protein
VFVRPIAIDVSTDRDAAPIVFRKGVERGPMFVERPGELVARSPARLEERGEEHFPTLIEGSTRDDCLPCG